MSQQTCTVAQMAAEHSPAKPPPFPTRAHAKGINIIGELLLLRRLFATSIPRLSRDISTLGVAAKNFAFCRPQYK